MSSGIDAKIAFETAGAGLSLLNTLIQMIREAKAKGGRDPRLSELLAKLRAQAVMVANGLVAEIEGLRQRFLENKFDLDRSINELQADTRWWQYLSEGYQLVRGFETRATALSNNVGQFMGDFVALAKCMDSPALVADSFRNVQDRQRELEAVIRRDVPVRSIFDKLLEHARRQQADLNSLN